MRSTLLSAVAALAIAAVAPVASAAVVYADSAIDTIIGTGNRAPGGDTDPNVTAVGAPDGNFYSPGIGGLLALDYNTTFNFGGSLQLFEITFVCEKNGGNGCKNFPEAAEIFVGSGWNAGYAAGATASDTVNNALALNAGFKSIGTYGNDLAVGGFVVSATITDPFSQVIVVDRSTAANVGSVNAGFDVDAIGVAPVPLPAAASLMIGAFGLVGWMGRRRSA